MKIYVCDVGGDDRYLMVVQGCVKSFIKRGHVAIIVYDVTSKTQNIELRT